jgi:lipopolysaccharide transport system permease protein
MTASIRLRNAAPAEGYGLFYAIRSARAWWYSAWLRTLARFSRTYLGSFWLGLSNLLSVAVLGLVYGTVFNVKDPIAYVIFIGVGITIWGMISQAATAGSTLFTSRREQLVNHALPPLFYCLEEWAFQVQTFAQAFAIILLAGTLLQLQQRIQPMLIVHVLISAWLPLLNLAAFCLWMIILMAILGGRFKDFSQLVPIVLQLLFLTSPILYKREGLGSLSFLADYNPFYHILAPVRDAALHGTLHPATQIITFAINILMIALLTLGLNRLRYRLPLWV